MEACLYGSPRPQMLSSPLQRLLILHYAGRGAARPAVKRCENKIVGAAGRRRDSRERNTGRAGSAVAKVARRAPVARSRLTEIPPAEAALRMKSSCASAGFSGRSAKTATEPNIATRKPPPPSGVHTEGKASLKSITTRGSWHSRSWPPCWLPSRSTSPAPENCIAGCPGKCASSAEPWRLPAAPNALGRAAKPASSCSTLRRHRHRGHNENRSTRG